MAQSAQCWFFFKPSQRTEWSQVRRLKHLHPIMQVWAESPGRQSNCMTGEFGLLSWIIPCWILCAYVSVTRIGSFSARILKGKAWASQELCNIFLAGNKFRPLIFFFFFSLKHWKETWGSKGMIVARKHGWFYCACYCAPRPQLGLESHCARHCPSAEQETILGLEACSID